MARRKDSATRDGEDDKAKSLQCFLNQPNINMVVPWIYDIYKNMAKPKSRDGGGEDDPIAKDLQCFLNQPNINMTIPWIYEIAKAVKSGGGGGGEGSDLEWDDRDFKEGD